MIPIAKKIVRPSRPMILETRERSFVSACSFWPAARARLLSSTILPNVITQAPGRIIIEYNSIRLERMVGFSSGVDELAPKKPPPLVPRCLMISSAAMGPCAMICLVPSMVVTTVLAMKFCGTPCHTSSRPPTIEKGIMIRVVIRTRSTKKLPTFSLVRPASPRIKATQAA